MVWRALTLEAAADAADRLADALLEGGAVSVSVEDADAGTPAEQAVFGEPGEPEAGLWSRNRLVALFPAAADIAAILAVAAHSQGVPVPADARVSEVADADWVRLTQSQFPPIPITDRLWIVPTWCEAPDPDAINIAIDPGVAFGTGSHATTRLCLAWLAQHLRPGETVLDYGCGSGILAIAASKLGAARVSGVDIDPQAVAAARDNARMNDVHAAFFTADAAPQEAADLVLANILTNPLKALAPLLAERTRPGGRIVLSGILEPQAEDVIAAYAVWFDMAPAAMDEGWACLWGTRGS